jgi:predicted Fe-S protein YdhL (DUF1289 family)
MGCGRLLAEILSWQNLSAKQRSDVLALAAARRSSQPLI